MSERCSNTIQLSLYLKDVSRPTTLFNVELLCDQCLASKKEVYDSLKGSFSIPRLSDKDIASAYLIAGNRCQCDNDECH